MEHHPSSPKLLLQARSAAAAAAAACRLTATTSASSPTSSSSSSSAPPSPSRRRVDAAVPVWQADSDVSACPICHNVFTLFYRRHHCRICGRVVCGTCSSSYIPYPPGTYVLPPYQQYPEPAGTLLRTCDDCIREPVSESTSYSSFPSASPARSSLPSLLYHTRSTSRTEPISLFSKGAILHASSSPVDDSASASSFTDRTRRASSSSSRPLHGLHRLSQSTPSNISSRIDYSPISPSTMPASPAPEVPSRSEVRTASSRLSSAFRFVGYGNIRNSSSSTSVPVSRVSGRTSGKASTVEQTWPSPSQDTVAKPGRQVSNHPEAGEGDDDGDSCPICGTKLSEFKTEGEREEHVNDCITNATFSGSPEQQRRRNRMVVYKLPESQAGKECVICFEEFEQGDLVARLECLCVYHRKCIKAWFEKKGVGECPIHAVHN